MSTPLFTYVTKSPKVIHDDFMRTVRNGLIQKGILQPNVALSGDYDVLATAIANEAAVSQANATILADQHMPDTATGIPPNSATVASLDRWGNLLGLPRRAAVPSHGVVNTACSAATTSISSAQQLKDSAGNIFQVVVGGTYAATAGIVSGIPVIAAGGGSATNHNNNDVMNWVSAAPPFCAPQANCGTPGGTDGLSGGADSEIGQDEPYRARILAQFATAQKGGNWAQVAFWAAASSPSVNFVSVYPALNGPGTLYFAVSGIVQTVPPFTSASKSRALSATLVANTVLPYVQGLLPEHVFVSALSSVDVPTDVAVQLSLPAAATGSPPGNGTGWVDGQPWPSTNAGTPVSVTSVTNNASFTVNAQTAPTDGVSHIAFLSPSNWTLYTATVLSHSGSTGAYVINLDTPMPTIAANNYIFPLAVNTQNYVNALLTAFASMGPGEWSSNATTLQRAFRHPTPTQAAPYSLTATQLKQIILSGTEVLDAAYLFRSTTTPAVPGALTTGPGILIPRNLGFYAA